MRWLPFVRSSGDSLLKPAISRPPTEIVKFNGVPRAVPSWQQSGTVQLRRPVHLRSISGQLFEVYGAMPIVVTTTDGREATFIPPFEISFVENALVIRSANSSGRSFRVEEVKKVEIEFSDD